MTDGQGKLFSFEAGDEQCGDESSGITEMWAPRLRLFDSDVSKEIICSKRALWLLTDIAIIFKNVFTHSQAPIASVT